MTTATLEEIRQLQAGNLKQAEQLKQESQATLEEVKAMNTSGNMLQSSRAIPWSIPLLGGLGVGMLAGIAIAGALF